MNAFIVSQERTGSTLLYEFIDSHPGIFCADELFIKRGVVDYRFRMIKLYTWYRDNKGWSIQEFLNWLFGLSHHSCVMIKYNQIEYFKKILPIISNSPTIQTVRNNYFKKTVSDFHTTDRIDRMIPNEYINEIRTAIEKDEVWSKTLKTSCPKYLKLVFENFIGRHETVRGIKYTFCNEKVGKKICKFFDVPYFEMFTATQKALTNKDYWSYIPEHFRDELKEKLSVFPKGVWQ